MLFAKFAEPGSVPALANYLKTEGVRSRAYLAGAGRVGAATPFRISPLIYILSNPTYLGEIRHGALRHAGQHEALVSRAIWETAQTHLMQRAPPGLGAGAHDESFLLRGVVFDSAGASLKLTVAHSTTGRTNRYYYIRRSSAAEAGMGIPADKLERIVMGVVVDRLSAGVAGAWAGLRVAARDRRIRRALHHVEVAEDRVRVTLDTRKLDPSSPRKRGRPPAGEPGPIIVVEAPFALRRRKAPTLTPGPLPPQRLQPDRGLVSAMCRAHLWREQLEGGTVRSLAGLAASQGVELSELTQLTPLAYLSPRLTEAVLSGKRLAPGLLGASVPSRWRDQDMRFLV